MAREAHSGTPSSGVRDVSDQPMPCLSMALDVSALSWGSAGALGTMTDATVDWSRLVRIDRQRRHSSRTTARGT
jgi:hypothetical protein